MSQIHLHALSFLLVQMTIGCTPNWIWGLQRICHMGYVGRAGRGTSNYPLIGVNGSQIYTSESEGCKLIMNQFLEKKHWAVPPKEKSQDSIKWKLELVHVVCRHQCHGCNVCSSQHARTKLFLRGGQRQKKTWSSPKSWLQWTRSPQNEVTLIL